MFPRAALVCLLFAGCADRPLYLPNADAGAARHADLAAPIDLAVSPDLGAGPPDLAAPDLAPQKLRQLAPLSGSTVTSRRPTLRWIGGGASTLVDLCRDRACNNAVATLSGAQGSVRPSGPLPAGVVFWRVRDGGEVSATWEFWVGARNAAVDIGTGSTLDVNGDGFADIAAATLQFQGDPGGVAVYTGGSGGLNPTRATLLPTLHAGAGRFGDWQTSNAGDLNGDGFSELAVSTIPNADTPSTVEGFVDLYFGGPAGLSTSAKTLSGPTPGTQFGRTVLGAGDINGDGYGDLLVTILDNDQNLDHDPLIFLGGPDGITQQDPSRILRITARGDAMGLRSAVGDFNGDGFGDVAISNDTNSSAQAGEVDVYFGGPNGLTGPTVIPAPVVTIQFGFYLTAADLDGDGYTDVIARAPSPNTAFVFTGGAAGIATTPARQISMAAGFDDFANAGDIDGDGGDDLIFGGQGSGAHAQLFLSGSGAIVDLPIVSGGAFSMAGANDTNGDHRDEMIVGHPPNVSVFSSLPADGGVSISAPLDIQHSDAGTTFGYSVAGRL